MADFGYKIAGANALKLHNQVYGGVFTITEAGTADSITAAIKTLSALPASSKVKCAIYKHIDLSLVGSTEERTIDFADTFTWETFNFDAPKPSLTIDTAYILAAWAEYASFKTVYMAGAAGDANQGHYDSEAYGANFPNPLEPTHSNFKASIYCTYTPGGPPPAGRSFGYIIG